MPTVQIPERIRETAHSLDTPAPPPLSERVSLSLATPGVRVVVAVTGFGLLLSGVFLFLPLAGTDLSAQVARAHFTKVYGSQPIDFRWYSGAQQYGYSLFSTWIMAVVGTRGVGALSAVVSSFAFALLLVRTRVRRPLLGGLIGAFCFVSNLVSGRMTFALGVMFGLLGLACLTLTGHRRTQLVGTGLGAFLASAASPVAGLFSGLAGTALVLTGRRREGIVTGVSAAVPIGVLSTVFGEGGWMNFNQLDMIKAVGLSLAATLLVPSKYRVVRAGAVLSAAGILVSYLVHTPVGSNSTRLAIMFTLPLVAATMQVNSVRHGTALLVALTAWQPPLIVGDLVDAGGPAAHRPYYAPLLTELERREPLGRVEVPPTRDYWESVYVADTVPLARGWMRQVDIERNPLFFDGSLSAVSYQRWLYDNGVEYVALPDTTLSWVGQGEADLIRTGLPYLRPVWSSQHWILYQVLGARTAVEAPGRLVDSTATGITLQVSQPGTVLVRVRFTHWLSVEGPAACIEPAGRWSRLVASQPGIYHIGSRLQPTQPSRCAGG
ncbi:MAG TPA: hypothetical protein VFX70_22640 [Mycobacteriales bacterium]|nr:hypothetical protein [Mycobacteriales bacterium]